MSNKTLIYLGKKEAEKKVHDSIPPVINGTPRDGESVVRG